MTAVALQHREAILQSIANGKRLTDLSEQLHVSPQAISKVLVKDPEYQAAIELGHAIRLDNAERAIEAASDQVEVARASASWRSIAWRAEKEVPSRWGNRMNIAMEVSVKVEERLSASAGELLGRIVDGDVVQERHGAVHDVESDVTLTFPTNQCVNSTQQSLASPSTTEDDDPAV